MEQSKSLVWIVTAVVVLGAGGIGWYFLGNSTPSFNKPDTNSGASEVATSTSENSLNASSTIPDNQYNNYQPSGS